MSLKSIKKFSHDIKTPLTVIRGFAEILHDGAIGELNPEQRTMVRKLQIRIDEVDSRVNDLVLGP